MGPAPYAPPRWLPGGHLQTLWPLLRKAGMPPYRRQRCSTPDGDFLDLDWLDGPPDAPLLVLFHGLEGNSGSHYARSLMLAAAGAGWNGVVANFRGCSGEPNKLFRAYHSGDSDEIHWILERLAEGHRRIHAIGVSLGGNALLKWLGERGEAAARVVCSAVAISAPLDLAAGNAALRRGFNRIYTRHFLATLIPKALAKARQYPGRLDTRRLRGCRSLADFDDAYTAPAHGFRDAAEYYRRSSAMGYLAGIRVPTLMINSLNDPFLPSRALPLPAMLGPAVRMETPAGGGHVGFPAGRFPGRLDWLPSRALSFLAP